MWRTLQSEGRSRPNSDQSMRGMSVFAQIHQCERIAYTKKFDGAVVRTGLVQRQMEVVR